MPLSQRTRLLYALLVPCLGFTVYTAYLFNSFRFNAIRESWTPAKFISPVPVCLPQEPGPLTLPPEHEVVSKPIQPHLFRSDGLLEVNPNGRHPIYDLIERAEAEWDKKLKRQSTTLEEAVVEYQRRYRRAPPRGFDQWWSYCKRHNVQLPDEYDRIYHDLEPFWGIHPIEVERLRVELASSHESYTLGKTEQDSNVTLLTDTLPENTSATKYHIVTAKKIAGMVDEVSKYIPPFRALFSPHDNPNRMTDWGLRTLAIEAAAAGTHINVNTTPPVGKLGWPSSCSPESRLRRTTFNFDIPPLPPTKKTFIHDHAKAMDPCAHPSLLHHVGQFLSHGQGPTPDQSMIPMFSYCSTTLHYSIHTAVKWTDNPLPEEDPKFQDRLDERLGWRGSTTGMWQAEDTAWRLSQRVRLVGWANERNGTAAVLQSTKSRNVRVGEGLPVAKARLNPTMLDITFIGKPHSCKEPICRIMADEFEFRNPQGAVAAGNYKYVLDIDGNGWSSRYKRLIGSHALIFKATVFPEWFQDRIQPWVHYVPFQMDLSDLYDSLTFFRGDLKGEGAHKDLASQIALAGRNWTRTFWRDEDMSAYMFRLFLEYARVMSVDRDAMFYRKEGE